MLPLIKAASFAYQLPFPSNSVLSPLHRVSKPELGIDLWAALINLTKRDSIFPPSPYASHTRVRVLQVRAGLQATPRTDVHSTAQARTLTLPFSPRVRSTGRGRESGGRGHTPPRSSNVGPCRQVNRGGDDAPAWGIRAYVRARVDEMSPGSWTNHSGIVPGEQLVPSAPPPPTGPAGSQSA